jgi:hypothetical protein
MLGRKFARHMEVNHGAGLSWRGRRGRRGRRDGTGVARACGPL